MGTGRGRVWSSLLVAAGLLAACGSSEAAGGGGGGDGAAVTSTTAEPTTTTAAETTTSRVLTEEEVVVQTVADMWLTLKRVASAPDPGNPDLARYMTGQQLEQSTAVMAKWQLYGKWLQESPDNRWEHRPRLVSIDGGEALVEDCATDDLWLMARDSEGRLMLENGSSVVDLWHVRLTKTAEGWRVYATEQVDTWYSGDPGCTVNW